MASNVSNEKKKRRINPWLIIGIVIIALAICVGVVITVLPRNGPAGGGSSGSSGSGGSSSSGVVGNQATSTVKRGSIIGTVSGSGTIEPEQTLDLEFSTTGIVKQVLVKEGDVVKTGQTLAVLDTRDLESKVESAQADLTSAQATLAQKQQGNGTAAELASAQAAVESAQANYDKVVAGPTKAALTSAQTALSSAQAAYTAATTSAEAASSDIESLKATLLKAQVTLQQAQSAYDRIGGATNSNIGMTQQSKDLQNATIEYAQAKANYEAKLKTSGPDAQSSVASARATVASAKQTLDGLTPTADAIAAAKSTLETAKSNLAALNAPATASDIAIAKANVTSAEQALNQAKLNLEATTLTAPFDAVVTDVSIVVGSNASGTVLSLMDREPLHVDLKLSENDVVEVTQGMAVNLTSDSIDNWKATGTVEYISPSGTTSNGVVTYAVRVNFSDADARVRVGMTSNIDIITAQKDNVLIVPTTALLPNGAGHVVEVVNADSTTKKVGVEIGLADGANTEITSGLNEGDKIITLPSSGSGTGTGGGGPFGG